MDKKYFSNLTLILVAVVISAAAVFVSLQTPIHWENNPPKCCDIPNGGTHYGFPLPIKGESCCGIAGTPLQFSNYQVAIYNFVIYFLVLIFLLILLRRLVMKRDQHTQ